MSYGIQYVVAYSVVKFKHCLSGLISPPVSQLLHREKDLEKQHQERDELRAKMEEQSRECVHLNQTKERLEADLAESHEKLRIAHLEVHLSLWLRLHVFMCCLCAPMCGSEMRRKNPVLLTKSSTAGTHWAKMSMCAIYWNF